MRSWARAALGVAELLVSAAIHLGYAFYIFGTAVAADVSASLVKGLMAGGGVAKDVVVDGEDEAAAVLDDGAVPPIVLVHGIFGFGKGVRSSFCFLLPVVRFVTGSQVGRVRCRGWAGCRTSPARRRRTTGCWCRTWARSPASTTGIIHLFYCCCSLMSHHASCGVSIPLHR